jgi:hypothetical protein
LRQRHQQFDRAGWRFGNGGRQRAGLVVETVPGMQQGALLQPRLVPKALHQGRTGETTGLGQALEGERFRAMLVDQSQCGFQHLLVGLGFGPGHLDILI